MLRISYGMKELLFNAFYAFQGFHEQGTGAGYVQTDVAFARLRTVHGAGVDPDAGVL